MNPLREGPSTIRRPEPQPIAADEPTNVVQRSALSAAARRQALAQGHGSGATPTRATPTRATPTRATPTHALALAQALAPAPSPASATHTAAKGMRVSGSRIRQRSRATPVGLRQQTLREGNVGHHGQAVSAR